MFLWIRRMQFWEPCRKLFAQGPKKFKNSKSVDSRAYGHTCWTMDQWPDIESRCVPRWPPPQRRQCLQCIDAEMIKGGRRSPEKKRSSTHCKKNAKSKVIVIAMPKIHICSAKCGGKYEAQNYWTKNWSIEPIEELFYHLGTIKRGKLTIAIWADFLSANHM